MPYLLDKYKGVYRIKCEFDLHKNQYPRKLNNTYDDSDLYIDCQHGIKVFYFGSGILQAYIPTLVRGRRLVREFGECIFGIEELDSEVLFKFKHSDADKILPRLNPKTSGADISPYSSRNLPKNKSYIIPDDELSLYKEMIKNVPKERILSISHITKNFMMTINKQKDGYELVKSDMVSKGMNPKQYIHSIGKWNDYLRYLRKELNNEEAKN